MLFQICKKTPRHLITNEFAVEGQWGWLSVFIIPIEIVFGARSGGRHPAIKDVIFNRNDVRYPAREQGQILS